MDFQTFVPPEKLAPFIKYFWALESNGAEDAGRTFSAIPDGCPGVIMVRSEKEVFSMDNDRKLPNIFLYGQSVAPASLSSSGKVGAIGICFQPHALKSLFGMDADELTNSCVDLTQVGKKTNLPEQLFNATDIDEQIRILSCHLFEQQQSHKRHPDELTKYAIAQLTASRGALSIKELQQKVRMSERSLERKFKESVGMSPKLFARILRFQESMDQLRKSDYEKLADIAYQNNYADQSHFIRVFKEFTGYSPLDFKRQSNEVVENFPEMKPKA